MTDLAEVPAVQGLDLPFEKGGARLAALPKAPRRSVMPFRGQAGPVSEALAAAIGAGLPPSGRVQDLPEGAGRIVWAGRDLWFVEGAGAVQVDLDGLAAVTDQSDAWVGFRLSGPDAREVLARVVPIDTHPTILPAGHSVRTLLRHISCLIVAGADGYDILVMRSFTVSAVDDLVTAMRRVAGRATLAEVEAGAR